MGAKTTPRRYKKKKNAAPPALNGLGLVAADCFVAFVWTSLSSLLAEVADIFLQHRLIAPLGSFAVNAILLVAALCSIDPLCRITNGMFNPLNALAFGLSGRNSYLIALLRVGSQLVGAMASTYLCLLVIPLELQGKFPLLAAGLKPGITLQTGAMVEGALAFASAYILLANPNLKSKLLAYWGPLIATIALCWIGSTFTGPSMNPMMAFAWSWHYEVHSFAEHWGVFWIAPIVGTVLGTWAFGAVHNPGEVSSNKHEESVKVDRKKSANTPSTAAVKQGGRKVNGEMTGGEGVVKRRGGGERSRSRSKGRMDEGSRDSKGRKEPSRRVQSKVNGKLRTKEL